MDPGMIAAPKPKRAPPPAFSYVLRTATMRTEYKGAIAQGLRVAFVSLDPLTRRKLLVDLESVHTKMLEREALAIIGEEPEQGIDPMGRLP